MSSIYHINKGIGKSIEFRGLKAQYIWYFAGGVLALMVLFSILYIMGLNTFVCLAVIMGLGAALLVKLYGWSSKYGEHGMMKTIARRKTPKVIKAYSRRIFQELNTMTSRQVR
ncbi:MAG: DUF4133 domain-containing protein [Bacteroidota bacterium]